MIDGFFDISFRMEELSKNGDSLVQLKGSVDWELYRQDLEVIRVKDRKSPAGRKPFDVVLMFKILVLQHVPYQASASHQQHPCFSRASMPGYNVSNHPLLSRGSTIPNR